MYKLDERGFHWHAITASIRGNDKHDTELLKGLFCGQMSALDLKRLKSNPHEESRICKSKPSNQQTNMKCDVPIISIKVNCNSIKIRDM
jgi:hypothetical protein